MPVEIFVQEQGKLVTVWLTREKLIETILGAALEDGGWTLSGTKADPDMTAMAIQALAPYYKTNETVKAAVDKALEALSALQRNDGGFGSWGTVNSESCAQVIVALTALGSNTPATGDTGVLVWVIALPVTALAAAFVLKRKEREA